MAVPSRGAKNFANILLLVLKTLNVYSHWAISDEFERTAPTLVFLLMLSCRMVVDWQLSRKSDEVQTNTKIDPTKEQLSLNHANKAAIKKTN